MSVSDTPLRVGDSVVVKPGVADPDTGTDISGWQGRVAEIYPGVAPVITPASATAPSAAEAPGLLVSIRWDSITLMNMPASLIMLCEEQGLDWATMGLGADEVMRAEARDVEADVARAKALLDSRYGWLAFGGEQGKRIQGVVNSAASPQEADVFEAWHNHLQANLRFPFQASVSEYQLEYRRGPIRQGDSLKVLDITMLDDSYGTIVAAKHGHGLYELPLCDLEVTERTSPNYTLVDDYSVWFANR